MFMTWVFLFFISGARKYGAYACMHGVYLLYRTRMTFSFFSLSPWLHHTAVALFFFTLEAEGWIRIIHGAYMCVCSRRFQRVSYHTMTIEWGGGNVSSLTIPWVFFCWRVVPVYRDWWRVHLESFWYCTNVV